MKMSQQTTDENFPSLKLQYAPSQKEGVIRRNYFLTLNANSSPAQLYFSSILTSTL